MRNFRPYRGVVGLYFIFAQSIAIRYPFAESRLLYIGMSERRTNSVFSRLQGHFDGSSKNIGLTNYRSVDSLMFTVLNFEMLQNVWTRSIESLESYFIADFVSEYGVYPVCNNKSGTERTGTDDSHSLIIDWKFFAS